VPQSPVSPMGQCFEVNLGSGDAEMHLVGRLLRLGKNHVGSETWP
jgi:hypothetical protein